jgi:hypothetical protein
MAIKRLTKEDNAVHFGVFNPVGYLVLAFSSDAAAAEARRALLDGGWDEEDVLIYSASEERETMQRLLDHVSGSAGFGHEVTLMRLYKAMADKGCGWLMVYAPDDAQCEAALNIGRQHSAQLAEKYHRLVIEDLI